ncbi:hypothetical protein ACOSQ3_017406 [Xanthoceras sorbifolium]
MGTEFFSSPPAVPSRLLEEDTGSVVVFLVFFGFSGSALHYCTKKKMHIYKFPKAKKVYDQFILYFIFDRIQVEDVVGFHACTPFHVFTPQSQYVSVPMTQNMSQFENARCHLLHWYLNDDFEDQIVAEGRISSTNPKDKVHNIPLGRGYWRVWIDAVFNNIKICRSTNEYCNIPNFEYI